MTIEKVIHPIELNGKEVILNEPLLAIITSLLLCLWEVLNFMLPFSSVSLIVVATKIKRFLNGELHAHLRCGWSIVSHWLSSRLEHTSDLKAVLESAAIISPRQLWIHILEVITMSSYKKRRTPINSNAAYIRETSSQEWLRCCFFAYMWPYGSKLRMNWYT